MGVYQMNRLFIIAAFVVQFFAVRAFYLHLGHERALFEAEQQFYTGDVGYCLADVPPHPGDCIEKDTNGIKVENY